MTPDELERRFTLLTAAARYDTLRLRDALASADGGDESEPDAGLTRNEALELLGLGEVIARKAGYGRQLTVRSARRAGASWSEIGAALGTSKQAAWETHNRWIDGQGEQRPGHWGLDEKELKAARRLAGEKGK
ncbi:MULTISPECIES: hypothetical protein [Thermomonosporaceae]|uniref:hypothetical protein n=1 Tax=Thermomonosporaceae TaxID=2012 RepID=UPI00255AD1A6|nr:MULTISPECIES: hypothetical protein [Thermomonosporaceae]MDL4773186.1 hypothetical protein [Actinomadura xylanilytica]